MAKKVQRMSVAAPAAILDLIEQQTVKIKQLEEANEELARLHKEQKDAAAKRRYVFVISMRNQPSVWWIFPTLQACENKLAEHAKMFGYTLKKHSAYPAYHQMQDASGWTVSEYIIREVRVESDPDDL